MGSRLIKGTDVRNTDAVIAVDACEGSLKPAPEVDRIISEIHRKYDTKLYQYLAHRLNSRQDMEDVAQEVYLRLIRHTDLRKLKPSWSLVRKIASNILIDRYRSECSRKAEAHVPYNDALVESPVPSPYEMVRSKEGMALIEDVFKTLNKNTRKAIILYRFKGYTYDEIAE
ncbi:MAG: RNA polymerase sigma factor, partial [Deltaproteobacteria bacterium]|nr:RNA polymerase sigma factor [Deltaproteobacteria bacterium]